jgi:hypothetical protein
MWKGENNRAEKKPEKMGKTRDPEYEYGEDC